MIILDKNLSSIEFNKTNYFNDMTDIELSYRIKSIHTFYPEMSFINNIRTLYSNLTDDFTNEEISAIKYFHTLISYSFKHKLPKLCPNTDEIGYIKLKENIDWNFPYTINHCVVLPISFLKTICSSFSSIMPVKSSNVWNLVRPNYKTINKIACTICHEWIHISQRYKLKNEFNEIYTKIWGFSPFNYNHILKKSSKCFITNPDGKNGDWSVILQGLRLFPILVLDNTTNKPIGGLYNPINDTIYSYTSGYIQNFGGLTDQLYHPNEIFANLVSQYIIYGNMFISNWNTSQFYFSLNKFI